MPRTLAGCLLLVGALTWPVDATPQSPARGLAAGQFSAALTLLMDGSVDVRETIVLRFGDRAASEFERELTLKGLDDVIDVRAAMDGQPLEQGEGDGQVQIRRGRRTLRVIWRFPDTVGRTRTFVLEYRAMGVLALSRGRASLAWPVLPQGHRYPIDQATVEWRVPASVVRLVPTTVDDPRWTSAAMADGWTATRTGIGPGETATLVDAFDQTTLAASVPVWQRNLDRAEQMAPAFVVGALTLIVMGAGVVGMTRFRYHRPRVDPSVVAPAAANSLPPALGTSLVRGRVAIGIPQLQAALLDLVRRNIITIRGTGQGDGPSPPYRMVMPMPRGLRPHEQVMADALWPHLKNDETELQAGWTLMQRALPAFRRAVLEELTESGLLDGERRAAGRGLGIAGWAVVALGVAGLVVFANVFGHLGDLPLVVPGAVVACGLMFLIAGQLTSVLSSEGETAAVAWRARRRELAVALRDPATAGDLGDWLPVAAGLGLMRAMGKRGVAVPQWFAQLSNRAG